MSNKQRLDIANTKFEGQLIKMIDELEEQKSPEGQYVWGKYEEKTITNPVITLTRGDNCMIASSAEIDLSKVTAEFFNGFVYPDSPEKYYFYYENGALYYYSNGAHAMTYDATTQTLYGFSDGGDFAYTGNKILHEFVNYVVADDENAYPDGGEQNGYWYEKIIPGATIKSGTASATSYTDPSTLKIAHGLGKTPTIYGVYSGSVAISGSYGSQSYIYVTVDSTYITIQGRMYCSGLGSYNSCKLTNVKWYAGR
jgi:hypothetical protein